MNDIKQTEKYTGLTTNSKIKSKKLSNKVITHVSYIEKCET